MTLKEGKNWGYFEFCGLRRSRFSAPYLTACSGASLILKFYEKLQLRPFIISQRQTREKWYMSVFGRKPIFWQKNKLPAQQILIFRLVAKYVS